MITIDNIHYNIKEKSILSGVSAQFKPGEIIGIIGKNGCGKTTLLKMLSQLITPNEGSIDLKNKTITYLPPIIETPFLFTVTDIISMGYYPNPMPEDVLDTIISSFNLEALKNQSYTHLSSGEKQRVTLAQIFARNKDVYCLDEPVSFCDIYQQKEIIKTLNKIKTHQGKTLLIVSHNLHFLSHVCDRGFMLKHGKLTEIKGKISQAIDF